MKHRTGLVRSAMLAAALFAVSGYASSFNYEQSLARGAVPDVTPQQKYRTAIREAGGAYKESLRDCAQSTEDRRECTREAKLTYDRDMADARWILSGREPAQFRAGR